MRVIELCAPRIAPDAPAQAQTVSGEPHGAIQAASRPRGNAKKANLSQAEPNMAIARRDEGATACSNPRADAGQAKDQSERDARNHLPPGARLLRAPRAALA